MNLSLIIHTWNNSERLARTLRSLQQCVGPPNVRWELILVDNNCTDETRHVAERMSSRLPLVYVLEPRQGVSRAKNAGLAAASGELIAFLDDDMRPCAEWMATYWAAYWEKPSGFYFGGPIIPEYESEMPAPELTGVAAFASLVGLDLGSEERVLSRPEALQSNWACPADPLRAVGGFDVRLGLDGSLKRQRVGEEFDIMNRLEKAGLLPWYLPRACVLHFVPAKKCTYRHVAGRAEAHGEYSVVAISDTDPSRYRYVGPFLRKGRSVRSWCEDSGITLAGVPWRLFVKAVALWGRLLLATAGWRTGYQARLSFRFCVGMMRGCRRMRRENAEPDPALNQSAPRLASVHGEQTRYSGPYRPLDEPPHGMRIRSPRPVPRTRTRSRS